MSRQACSCRMLVAAMLAAPAAARADSLFGFHVGGFFPSRRGRPHRRGRAGRKPELSHAGRCRTSTTARCSTAPSSAASICSASATGSKPASSVGYYQKSEASYYSDFERSRRNGHRPGHQGEDRARHGERARLPDWPHDARAAVRRRRHQFLPVEVQRERRVHRLLAARRPSGVPRQRSRTTARRSGAMFLAGVRAPIGDRFLIGGEFRWQDGKRRSRSRATTSPATNSISAATTRWPGSTSVLTFNGSRLQLRRAGNASDLEPPDLKAWLTGLAYGSGLPVASSIERDAAAFADAIEACEETRRLGRAAARARRRLRLALRSAPSRRAGRAPCRLSVQIWPMPSWM